MPQPADRGKTTHTYVLTARIVDGTLTLEGTGYERGVISVPAGDDVVVRIDDTDTHYLIASGIAPRGETCSCWERDASGYTERQYRAVDSLNVNIVVAASKSDDGDITYGPIIKVKPQG